MKCCEGEGWGGAPAVDKDVELIGEGVSKTVQSSFQPLNPTRHHSLCHNLLTPDCWNFMVDVTFYVESFVDKG